MLALLIVAGVHGLADWTPETGPRCPFECLRLNSNGRQLSQIGNCGCTCTTGIEAAKNGIAYPEVYIVSGGYYANCGFINDPKILCGCARECTNLQVDERELMAGGECPAYLGEQYEQTCDGTFRDSSLAAGGETSLAQAMETLRTVIATTSGSGTAYLGESVVRSIEGATSTIRAHRELIRTKEALIKQVRSSPSGDRPLPIGRPSPPNQATLPSPSRDRPHRATLPIRPLSHALGGVLSRY